MEAHGTSIEEKKKDPNDLSILTNPTDLYFSNSRSTGEISD